MTYQNDANAKWICFSVTEKRERNLNWRWLWRSAVCQKIDLYIPTILFNQSKHLLVKLDVLWLTLNPKERIISNVYSTNLKPWHMCQGQKSHFMGNGHPTFNRESLCWVYKPYYWVDDHPLYWNNGGLDPSTYKNKLVGRFVVTPIRSTKLLHFKAPSYITTG